MWVRLLDKSKPNSRTETYSVAMAWYTEVGVPQGGPLSPLCANIMLNELDHELERRGHSFVRYADDMVIFCGSKASAEQTLEHIRLLALEGAIQGVKKTGLADAVKADLKAFYQEHKQ